MDDARWPHHPRQSETQNSQQGPPTQHFLTDSRRIEPWGDKLPTKPPSTLRVCFQNIGGFPPYLSHTKNRQIINVINSLHIDVFAASEMNQCWHNVPVQDRLHERTRGWWEQLHLSFSYLRSFPSSSTFQPGGVCLFSLNQVGHRVHSSGADPAKLGPVDLDPLSRPEQFGTSHSICLPTRY